MRKLIASAVTGTLLAGGMIAAAVPAHAIAGGTTVSSAPWMVQVSTTTGLCSGSIIAPHWVITAAHCLAGEKSTKVFVGSVYKDAGTKATVVRSYAKDDVALAYIDKAINTHYAKLASREPLKGAITTIYGWGITSLDAPSLPKHLLRATMRVTGFSTIQGGRVILCEKVSGVALPGDSGGPQFYNGEQVGAFSYYSLDTPVDQTIDFYSSIPQHRAWIRQITGV